MAARRNNILTIIMLLSLTALISCGKSELSPLDYVRWIEDEANDLRETKAFGEIEVTVQYKPLDYVVAIEKKDTELKAGTLKSRKTDLEGLQHYMIRLSTADKSKDFMKYDITSEEEYYQRQNYFSFGFQQDLVLVEDGDTLPCVLFSCVRNYGLSPNVDFAIAFESKRKSDTPVDRTLIINDQVLGVGTLKFKTSKEAINNIPTIRTF